MAEGSERRCCGRVAVEPLDPRIAPKELERQVGEGLPFGGGEEEGGDGGEEGAELLAELRTIELLDEEGKRLHSLFTPSFGPNPLRRFIQLSFGGGIGAEIRIAIGGGAR